MDAGYTARTDCDNCPGVRCTTGRPPHFATRLCQHYITSKALMYKQGAHSLSLHEAPVHGARGPYPQRDYN